MSSTSCNNGIATRVRSSFWLLESDERKASSRIARARTYFQIRPFEVLSSDGARAAHLVTPLTAVGKHLASTTGATADGLIVPIIDTRGDGRHQHWLVS